MNNNPRFVSDDKLPEEFIVSELPQVKDAISRMSPIDCYQIALQLTESTDNPHIRELHVDMHYEDGKLPPPREFVAWVDGYDLIVQHIAEMP